MTDVMTPAQRSRCMSRIHGKNTSPETQLRKALWATGLRYRIHAKLPGRPDIIFPALKIAIFVDGCFWHRCPEHGVMPKTNREFWKAKLSGIVKRDRKIGKELKRLGWHVLRYWEHQVEADLEMVSREISLTIDSRKRALGLVD